MALFSSKNGNGSAPVQAPDESPALNSYSPPPSTNGADATAGDHSVRLTQSSPVDATIEVRLTPDIIDHDVEGPERGVHQVTKKTDYWFEREVYEIEKQAREAARMWAEKGLPRHDVPRTEPFEPEQVLAKRCAQLFRDWQLRVRTKMQDAIERGSQQLGEQVATLRSRVARLDTLGLELSEREGKIEKIRRELESADGRPVRYTPFVPTWVFWTCAVLLVLVEFFANFPIFRLLLPLDGALEQAAANAAANVDDSWLAGIQLFGKNLLWNIEAGLVAAVAVIVLVVLGKQFGKSLRPIVTLKESDHPLASHTVRTHKRQHIASLTISAIGLACVLAFLGITRERIAITADSRVYQDSTLLNGKEAAFDKAKAKNDHAEMSRLEQSIQTVGDALERHKDAAAYAKTVKLNNWSIFFLNLGLIATAAMLGFGNAHADLGERHGEHPDLVKLRDRCAELRRDMVTVEAEARTAVGHGRGSIGYVQHLLRSHPLRGWESKMKRLEGVVPLFRGENARERGLDPANVRAFDLPPALELPPLDEAISFTEPTEFARLKDELDELTSRLAQLSIRSSQMRPDLHVA